MINNILENLKEKYVGQEFERGYGVWSDIGCYVCERLEQEYKVPFAYRSSGYKNESILICYKDWGICRIDFKKKRGELKHNLFRGYYYIWTIKDIEITKCIGYGSLNQESTVEDYIKVINDIIQDEQNMQNEKDKQLKEAFYLLKEHFGFDDNYKVKDLIRQVDNAYYRLFYDEEIRRNAED